MTSVRPDRSDLSAQWTLGKTILSGEKGHEVQDFTCRASRRPSGGWRLWFSAQDEETGGGSFGYLDLSEDFEVERRTMMKRAGQPGGTGLVLVGVPAEWDLTQPVHLELPDGRERLYFWAHGKNVCRFLAADSEDGVTYVVEDWRRPVLYHPGDRAVPRQLLIDHELWLYVRPEECPRAPGEPAATTDQLMNDATNVYLRPDGSFELYSAEVIMCPPSPEPRQKDPVIRFIQRRTSADGLHWSAPQRILIRDAEDPYDLQFYYLAVTFTNQGRLGMLGHYRSDAGTGDVEFCYSRDGVEWRRERVPGFPRRPGVEGVYAPHDLVEFNGKYYLFYTGNNCTHDGVVSPAAAAAGLPYTWIGVATIPVDAFRGRFAP